jgi:iron complex transport system substrate-binding protein
MSLRNGAPAAELGRRAQTSSLLPRRPGLSLGVLALLALAPRAARAQVELRDDRGATVTLARAPLRIVSLLPSLTESVCALGACARLVATDRFSNWPESVRALPKVGGMEDALIERIVALRPDVVLVSATARAIGRLEALGLKVVALESRDRADVQRTLTLLGRMLDAPAAAARVEADIERDTRAAAARVPAALRGKRVYFEVDASLYAAGPGSFIGETLARLGLDNAIPAALGPFPKLNPEFVVRAQPDIIMATQQGLADMSKRPGWSTLRALATAQTCGFSGPRYELLVRPGPRMGEAAALLADCLAAIAKAR